MSYFKKDPNAILDYGFNWASWLVTGETITTSTWTVPTGITQYDTGRSNTVTTIWLSGGTVGGEYDIVNHIVTSDGREEDRTLTVAVMER